MLFKNRLTGETFHGDIKHQRRKDPIKRDKDGNPLEEEKYVPCEEKPEDKKYVKYNNSTDKWVTDQEAIDRAVDNYTITLLPDLIIALLDNENFNKLPVSVKNALQPIKKKKDDFIVGL